MRGNLSFCSLIAKRTEEHDTGRISLNLDLSALSKTNLRVHEEVRTPLYYFIRINHLEFANANIFILLILFIILFQVFS